MNKKIVLAVFMGLLASAAALVASLFMLQEIKKTSTIKENVDNLYNSVQKMDTEVNLDEVNGKIADVSVSVQTLASDVEELQVNQQKILETVNGAEPATSKPVVTPLPEPKKVEKTEKIPAIVEENGKLSSTTRLNFRKNPSLKSGIHRTLNSGEKVKVIGPEKEMEGYTWVKVSDSKGNTGWVAKRYTN